MTLLLPSRGEISSLSRWGPIIPIGSLDFTSVYFAQWYCILSLSGLRHSPSGLCHCRSASWMIRPSREYKRQGWSFKGSHITPMCAHSHIHCSLCVYYHTVCTNTNPMKQTQKQLIILFISSQFSSLPTIFCCKKLESYNSFVTKQAALRVDLLMQPPHVDLVTGGGSGKTTPANYQLRGREVGIFE